jgi:putative phage-type endonuclease|tara:strand:- start:577 stop:1461 length:885 start_codon:yes stop_codon:yes gene_type:complete
MGKFTERQKELRAKRIGSSEIAAVFGISPWMTAFDLWLTKTGQVIDVDDEKAWMTAGNHFEQGVLAFATEQLGPLRRNQFRVVPDLPLSATTDALVISTGNPVEAKTTGLYGPVKDIWGDEGTDQIPDYYNLQCQVHLMATGKEVCHVPAFIGGRGFCMFTVKAHPKLQAIIGNKAKEFWNNYVVPKVAPPDSLASLSVLKRVIRTPKKVVDVSSDLVSEWQAANAAKNDAIKEADEMKAQVIQAMGDAEAGILEGEEGPQAITYFSTERSGYTVKPSVVRTLQYLKKGLPKGM